MNINITLLESDATIRQNILDSIVDHIDQALSKSISYIKVDLETLVLDAIRHQPEYNSLISGQLKYELGIVSAYDVDKILSQIFDTIKIIKRNTSYNNSGITGGLIIEILSNDDLQKLTELPAGFVVDTKRGYSLPWLRWILLEGAKPIVKNYEVKIGPNKFSRTGMAVMIDSNESWSVPNAFAGTINNNWITRGIDSINNQSVENIIQNRLEKYI